MTEFPYNPTSVAETEIGIVETHTGSRLTVGVRLTPQLQNPPPQAPTIGFPL